MLNHNIPTLKCFIRKEFLTGKPSSDMVDAYAFAILSLKGHALYFSVMLQTGAMYRFIPIHEIFTVSEIKETYALEHLCLWDAFSHNPIVTVFDYLKGHECWAILRNKQSVQGEYLFTVDWLPDNNIETGLINELDQNKCMHVIQLWNGQLAGLPNNRILWKDAYFIGNRPYADKEGYKPISESFHAESSERWSVATDEEMYYKDEHE